jgi:hypothetical protein
MNEMLHDITPNEMSLDVCVSPKKSKQQPRLGNVFSSLAVECRVSLKSKKN